MLKKSKRILTGWNPVWVLAFLLLLPSRAAAERPFSFTESAVPIEKGFYRLETGFLYNRFSANRRQTVLSGSLRYGLIQNLELNFEVPYLFLESRGEHENQLGDLLMETKIRFLKGREANPLSVAGQMVVKFPSAGQDAFFETTGEPDIGFLAIASKEFTPITAHINFGYFFIGNPPFEDREDQLRYSIGLELELAEDISSITGELFGNTEIGSAASRGILGFLAGFAYRAEPALLLDFSAGFGITDDAPDYMFSAGVTHSFR